MFIILLYHNFILLSSIYIGRRSEIFYYTLPMRKLSKFTAISCLVWVLTMTWNVHAQKGACETYTTSKVRKMFNTNSGLKRVINKFRSSIRIKKRHIIACERRWIIDTNEVCIHSKIFVALWEPLLDSYKSMETSLKDSVDAIDDVALDMAVINRLSLVNGMIYCNSEAINNVSEGSRLSDLREANEILVRYRNLPHSIKNGLEREHILAEKYRELEEIMIRRIKSVELAWVLIDQIKKFMKNKIKPIVFTPNVNENIW